MIRHDATFRCTVDLTVYVCCSLLQFQQLCDETLSWINEKDQTLSTEDCGRDLPSVQALQRKHMVNTGTPNPENCTYHSFQIGETVTLKYFYGCCVKVIEPNTLIEHNIIQICMKIPTGP